MLAEVGSSQLVGSHFVAHGHQADIYEVGAARTAQMRVGEAIDLILIVVIATARIPRHHLLGLWA